MKNIIIIGLLVFVWSCKDHRANDTIVKAPQPNEAKIENVERIKVLNFGTFHMGLTTDANTTSFNEKDKENQRKIHEIAKLLSSFKPTVILVETTPEYDQKLQSLYSSYLQNPDMYFKNPSEVELLAFELGRLSNTQKIYGIDHKLSYNYLIAKDFKNTVDSVLIDNFYSEPLRFYPEININEDTLSLMDKLKLTNNDKYLDFLMTINADILTHVGTNEGFEGADEAAKYYQRNLRMYTNFNRINLNKDDRVFILLGASHTAFFRDFISRSPKYEMLNTFEYLE